MHLLIIICRKCRMETEGLVYEGQTNLFVNCKKGHGTKITILIPVQEELRDKAKVTDTGIEEEGMRE